MSGIQHAAFPFHIFPLKFQKMIIDVHNSYNIDVAAVATVALTVFSTRLGNGMKIEYGDKIVYPFLRSILYGGAGIGKSPLLGWFLRPIEEEFALYNKREKARWEALSLKDKKNNKPKYHVFVVNDTTREGKRVAHAASPRGWLAKDDEASSIFTAPGQYKRGGGDDVENELSSFGGSSSTIIRGKDMIFNENTEHGVIGGIQPVLFSKYFTDYTTVFRGLTPRYLFTAMSSKDPDNILLGHVTSNDSRNFWKTLLAYCDKVKFTEYENKLNVSTIFRLSSKAKVVYEKHWMQFYKMKSDPNIPEEQKIFIAKMDVHYFFKFIGILHVIRSFCDGRSSVDRQIVANRVEEAYQLILYYLSQIKDMMTEANAISKVEIIDYEFDALRLFVLMQEMLQESDKLWYSDVVKQFKDIKGLSLLNGELNESKLGHICKNYNIKIGRYENKSYILQQDMDEVIQRIRPEFFDDIKQLSLYLEEKIGMQYYNIITTMPHQFSRSSLKNRLDVRESRLDTIIEKLEEVKMIEIKNDKISFTHVAECFRDVVYGNSNKKGMLYTM